MSDRSHPQLSPSFLSSVTEDTYTVPCKKYSMARYLTSPKLSARIFGCEDILMTDKVWTPKVHIYIINTCEDTESNLKETFLPRSYPHDKKKDMSDSGCEQVGLPWHSGTL